MSAFDDDYVGLDFRNWEAFAFGGDILDAQIDAATARPPTLAPYSEALAAIFPQGQSFCGLAKGKVPLACTVLGSNVVSFQAGEGRWSRAIGIVPIPDINWAKPHLGPRLPPTALLAARKCKTPQEFRMWLNWVATKIMEACGRVLKDALHQDHFLPDLRFALQVAYDLHAMDTTFEMVFPEMPALHWRRDIKPLTHRTLVLQGGKSVGALLLQHQGGCWRYGFSLNQQDLVPQFQGLDPIRFKHQATEYLGLDPQGVEVAKGLAAKLFLSKTFEWLTATACKHPELRGT